MASCLSSTPERLMAVFQRHRHRDAEAHMIQMPIIQADDA
jgi:hypothetical protein